MGIFDSTVWCSTRHLYQSRSDWCDVWAVIEFEIGFEEFKFSGSAQ